jgi:hypothetical protein
VNQRTKGKKIERTFFWNAKRSVHDP